MKRVYSYTPAGCRCESASEEKCVFAAAPSAKGLVPRHQKHVNATLMSMNPSCPPPPPPTHTCSQQRGSDLPLSTYPQRSAHMSGFTMLLSRNIGAKFRQGQVLGLGPSGTSFDSESTGPPQDSRYLFIIYSAFLSSPASARPPPSIHPASQPSIHPSIRPSIRPWRWPLPITFCRTIGNLNQSAISRMCTC